jgi:hypothetical protein
MNKQRSNLYNTIQPSRIKSTIPSSEIDSLLAENAKLSERLKELTDKIETKSSMVTDLETKVDMMIGNNLSQKVLDDRLERISSDIKAALVSKQKTYEEQYFYLEKKYSKLKEAQEQQFFKFTHIISNYQMLIFKIMASQNLMIGPDEVQKLNELMSEVGASERQGAANNFQHHPRSKFSYTPSSQYDVVHTPHPAARSDSSHPSIRKHHSAVGFKLNLPKKVVEQEEILSENDNEYK